MSNPYKWNQVNLNLFYGRDALAAEIKRQFSLSGGNSFGLAGARRMGKTTLLRYVETALSASSKAMAETGTKLILVFIDGLALPRPITASFLWTYVLKYICRELCCDPPISDIDFSEFLSEIKRTLPAAEKVPRIVIIFDEIEHITVNDWSDAYFANWRALLGNYPEVSGSFSVIFSGAREMIGLQTDVGSPLGDILEWHNLECLANDDAERLMTEPMGLQLSKEVINLAIDETGGHPMLLQYVMQKMDGPAVTIEDMRTAIFDFERKRSWQMSDWWVKYCDEYARRVYSELPDSMEKVSISYFATKYGGHVSSCALEVLRHVGIIETSLDNTKVGRRGRIFSRWQAANGLVAAESLGDSILGGQLNKLDTDFGKKFFTAWLIYSSQLPNYSGAVGEMRDLITMVLHRLAPATAVVSQEGFKLERDQSTPTRRQRVMYIFREAKEQGKAVASDDELLDANAEKLAGLIGKAYSNASALTHTTSTKELAYSALKQAESVLAQLISVAAV